MFLFLGTGFAPMRALLQERSDLIDSNNIQEEVGSSFVFFGSRNRNEDFIYEDEIEGWFDSGVITSLALAFSREDPNQKTYVQDLMDVNHDIRCQLASAILDQNAVVYVCGGTKVR